MSHSLSGERLKDELLKLTALAKQQNVDEDQGHVAQQKKDNVAEPQ